MKEKVLITGKGNLSSLLYEKLADHFDVYFLSRHSGNQSFVWNVEKQYIDEEALSGVQHIIHLAGADISKKRWDRNRKKELFDSRVQSAQFLYEQLKKRTLRLKSFISTSAIGYYGEAVGVLTEDTPYGSDFLAKLCVAWEDVAHKFTDVAERVTILRMGIVLSQKFGALPKMLQSKSFFFIPLGTGKQSVAWVSASDVCRAFEFILTTGKTGIYNVVSPDVETTNESLNKTLSKLYNKPCLPVGVPYLLLRLVLGELSSMLMGGVKVSSKKLEEESFSFQHRELFSTLKEILMFKTSVQNKIDR